MIIFGTKQSKVQVNRSQYIGLILKLLVVPGIGAVYLLVLFCELSYLYQHIKCVDDILIMFRWCRSSGFLSEVPKNVNYPKKLCFRFGQRAVDMYAARRQTAKPSCLA